MHKRVPVANQLLSVTVFTIMIWLAPGCRSSGTTPSPSSSAIAPSNSEAMPVPEDFRLVCGQGGGFTGLWDGFTVQADGQVFSWSGRMAEENLTPAGKLDSEKVNALSSRLEQLGFFSMRLEEYGNMTAIIDLTSGGQQHRVSWPPKIGGLDTFTPIDSFYVECISTLREVE